MGVGEIVLEKIWQGGAGCGGESKTVAPRWQKTNAVGALGALGAYSVTMTHTTIIRKINAFLDSHGVDGGEATIDDIQTLLQADGIWPLRTAPNVRLTLDISDKTKNPCDSKASLAVVLMRIGYVPMKTASGRKKLRLLKDKRRSRVFFIFRIAE